MGFAPQINQSCATFPPTVNAAVQRAMPPEVEALARKYLRKPLVVQVGLRTQAVATVTHAVYPVPRERKSALLAELLKRPEMDSVLVFTRTKHGADRLVRHLERAGIDASAMHADKSQGQRMQALEGFREGKIRVLVATDIARAGLDIAGISHVINYDVPQRRGIRGTASAAPPCGGLGDAFHVHSPDEIGMVRTIERVLGTPIPRIAVPILWDCSRRRRRLRIADCVSNLCRRSSHAQSANPQSSLPPHSTFSRDKNRFRHTPSRNHEAEFPLQAVTEWG